MDSDPKSPAASGLARYAATVATLLGDDLISVDCDTTETPATALLVVRRHLPCLPDQLLVLTWDEVNGWALRVKLDEVGETSAITYLGTDVLPGPETVRTFLREALAGKHPGSVFPPWFRSPLDPDSLETRLARFA